VAWVLSIHAMPHHWAKNTQRGAAFLSNFEVRKHGNHCPVLDY